MFHVFNNTFTSSDEFVAWASKAQIRQDLFACLLRKIIKAWDIPIWHRHPSIIQMIDTIMIFLRIIKEEIYFTYLPDEQKFTYLTKSEKQMIRQLYM